MKRIFLTFIAFFAGTLLVYSQNAGEIVAASRDRIKADTISIRSRMVISSKDGTTSERKMDQYSKDGPKGSRSVAVFNSPASVAGTRFLTMENGNNNDQWIFLPSLGKVRRIASSEGSGSFMGSDFSYDDIASLSRDASLDTHTFLREETVAGNECYVIESKPKDTAYQYSRMIQYIEKDSKVNYKMELYDKKNTLIKIVEMGGVKDVQGRPTIHNTKMTSLTAGTSTTLYVDIIKYDDPIPESVFTPTFLETGRPR
jgi:outer membrane lipoprotein-sorting protein